MDHGHHRRRCGVTAAFGADSVRRHAKGAAMPTTRTCGSRTSTARSRSTGCKAQNAKSTAVLQADPDYQKYYDAILKVLDATDRIPYGELDHQYVTNFWQDAAHPKGIWRRTSVADYAKAAPALGGACWIWTSSRPTNTRTGCGRAPSAPRHSSAACSALARWRRCGGGARVRSGAASASCKDGFQLTEAKSAITYLDDDTVLFGTDFGPGSMTTSGYPRIVKLWKRGEPHGAGAARYTRARTRMSPPAERYSTTRTARSHSIQRGVTLLHLRVSTCSAARRDAAAAAAARRGPEGRAGRPSDVHAAR